MVLEYLDRYAESHHSGSGHSASEITRYRTLTRWRVCWAETHSKEAVAGIRLDHQALDRRDLHVGCGLAVELAEMLAVIEEIEEADALFFYTVKAGAAVGLYQVFLEGGPELGRLLRRAYTRAAARTATDPTCSRWWEACFRDGTQAKRAASRTAKRTPWRCADGTGTRCPGNDQSRLREQMHRPEFGDLAGDGEIAVKRIFSKLAASTRSEAVSRAGSLGLL